MNKMLKKTVSIVLCLSIVFMFSSIAISAVDIESIPTQAETNEVISGVGHTFSVQDGGTIIYDFVGTPNLFTNIVYTKTVYLPIEQVNVILRAIALDGFIDDLQSFVVDKSVSVITPAVASVIAALLGVSVSSCSFLIGLAIPFFMLFISKAVEWDLDDALDKSTTGKVKYISYYMTSITEPYYMEINTFEPWNSNEVEVYEDYEYIWLEGYYLDGVGDSNCNHTFNDYVSQNSQTHTRWCTSCGYIDKGLHTMSKWTAKNATEHKKTCSKCSYTKTGLHSDSYNQLLGKCNLCGYEGFIQIYSYNKFGIEKSKMILKS